MHGQNQCNKESVIKNVLCIAIAAVLGLAFWLDKYYTSDIKNNIEVVSDSQAVVSGGCVSHSTSPLLANKVKLDNQEVAPLSPAKEEKYVIPNLPNFTYAAKIATAAVVHIKARQDAKTVKQSLVNPLDQLFKDFFGEGFSVHPREYEKPAQECTGSGVLYTENGCIITNSHVIEGADQIEVVLNDNRHYVAQLIGSDPVTDLAILKIEGIKFPHLKLGSSDQLEVGEWVLAVGNPFNLNSTVTKGIVSAKHRSLGNHTGQKLTVQSFIQTDAVLNQGNSGGALVNLYGELVGINTAIISGRAASFIGYGFAIPSSLVKKVADDLIQYGAVQRVLLGVTISDVTAELAKKLGLQKIAGVYIHSVQENSPCVKLLQKEDVITQMNGRKIDKITELHEIIGCAKPGDKVTMTLYRKGKEKNIEIILEKEPDAVQVVQKNGALQVEGAIFETVDPKTKERLKLSSGVLVKEVTKGKFQAAGLKRGYILLSFDKQPVKNITELADLVRNTKGAVLLGVIEPYRGSISYLAVDFGGQLDAIPQQ